MTWYNRANAVSNDDASSILDLAIGFETLLALPKDSKTDRFVDVVSLLLGRAPRLDLWAKQFYEVRSEVAHEGATQRLRFIPTAPKKSKAEADALYQSLLAYGRQIFQLCVSTLVFGDQLAKSARLHNSLVTNQERFESICQTLDDDGLSPPERFTAIDSVVALIEEFRYVPETGLLIDTMLGAVRRAAKMLLLCSESLEPVLMQAIEKLAKPESSTDSYEALGALQALTELNTPISENSHSSLTITLRLAEVVASYTFMHYYWVKQQRIKAGKP
ncbi:MAG TPA: hypothetical protein VJ728_15580 [Candidatus Binataceae bacterium]|nr:hypothetical protein [Candidatus Binataceae bacterium]